MTEVTPLYPTLPSSLQQDHSRPSLFELLAEEQLRDLLHPVVRYVLSYLAQRYPRYFLRVLNHHEEVFAGLLLLIERHHLNKHNASLSEHFYQLRLAPTRSFPTPRLDAIDPPKPRSLTRRQRWGMLLVLVGLPYLRARAQDHYDRLGGARDPEAGEPEIVPTTTLQRTFKAVYPYANLVFDVTMLGYDVAYLFAKTGDYRPWHRLLGLRVQRRGQEEEAPTPSGLLASLPPLLPPLLLLLKISQWWYSPTSPRTLASLGPASSSSAKVHANILPPRPLPILPSSHLTVFPPTPPDSPALSARDDSGEVGATGAGEHADYTIGKGEYGTCPLCSKKWQNPAILPSGWVVCWRCGWEAVEGESEGEEETDENGDEEDRIRAGDEGDEAGKNGEHDRQNDRPRELTRKGGRRGRCPITGVEVGPGQLRRVLV